MSTIMRRLVLALATCLAISPMAFPAQTQKPPKVKSHKAPKVKGHKAQKVKRSKRPVIKNN